MSLLYDFLCHLSMDHLKDKNWLYNRFIFHLLKHNIDIEY